MQNIALEDVPDYGKLAPPKLSVVNNLTMNLVAGQLQVRQEAFMKTV